MEGRKREVHRGRDTCIACTRSRMSRRGRKKKKGSNRKRRGGGTGGGWREEREERLKQAIAAFINSFGL